jgi:tetratricopeptide (TPR) repeat protein
MDVQMKNMFLFLLTIFGFFGIAQGQGQAPESAFAEVDTLISDARLAELGDLYDEILASYPEDRRALVGRAGTYSWLGQRADARALFQRVLADEPEAIDALTGLGYDYAWGGDYADAEATFLRVLALDAQNAAAQKGLGFTYLWSGKLADAEARFRSAADDHPEDAEAKRGIGQTLMALRRGRAAEAAFQSALAIDPNDAAARDGVAAARQVTGPFEASIWVGNSAAGGDVDVRALQLTSWVAPGTSLRLRLDDSLSLDNPALARSGVDARATFASVTREFSPRFIGSLEIGRRDLPGTFEQDIYKLEAALPRSGKTWKFGYQSSPHSAGFDDSLAFAGIGLSLSDRLTLDTTLFQAETGAAKDSESRLAFFLEHRGIRGWSVGGGFGVGSVSSESAAADGTVTTANLLASFPLTRLLTTHFQLRWENAPLDDFTVATFGITVRPGRR